jgi:hypothetical protein
MPTKKLPPELISLVHPVELNKAGWWDNAVQRLIIAAIWLANRPLTKSEVLAALDDQFSVVTNLMRLRVPFARLVADGTLLELPTTALQISQQALQKFEKELQEGDEAEKKAKSRFLACLRTSCPSIDGETAWTAFTEKLLLPLVTRGWRKSLSVGRR